MKLRTKIILVCSLATAAISAGAGLVAIYATSAAELFQLDSKLDSLATASVLSEDPIGSALLAIDSVGADTEVGFFSINADYSPLSDSQGVILTTPTSSQLKIASKHPVSISPETGESYRLRTAAMPDNEYVVFATSLTPMAQKTSSSILLWVGVMSSAILLGALVLWLITRRDLSRIEILIRKAKQISNGDFDVKLEQTEGKSELDTLNNSLANMLETLNSALQREKLGQQRTKEFLADASHELKTPLTVIRGYSELLKRGDNLEPELITRSQDRIQNQIQRMQSLIEDMLLLVEIDQTIEHGTQTVNLSEVVRMAFDDLKAIHPNRNIELRVAGKVLVSGTQRLLDQLLANLISNLSRYVDPKFKIQVKLYQSESLAVLQIDDAGEGLPDSAYRTGIQYFTRFDPSRSRDSGGSGLGISIMSAIVAKHRGTIELRPSELGGLCTLINLPINRNFSDAASDTKITIEATGEELEAASATQVKNNT
jgi:two-component system OmpR family sensor kinase